MKSRHILGSLGALCACGVVASCISSTPTGPVNGEDAGILVCSSDASVVTVAAQVDAGLCSSCVQAQCGTLLATCSTDCVCNDNALQAIDCIESLGASPTTPAITSCVTTIGNSTDSTLEQLATCLQGCAGACGVDAGKDASVPEAGPDATISEAGVDSSIADTGSDVATVDAGVDAADAGVDAAPGEDASTCITTISGTVYDPAGNDPLPGVTVFTPAGSLVPFTGGATCSCSGLASPYALQTVTDVHGQFTLSGLPQESSLAVVVQTGKWRRTFSLVITPCVDNVISTKFQLPSSGAQGDMPNIAVSTGEADSLECLLSRVGVGSSEFVAGASTAGHVHVFNGGNAAADAGLAGLPEKNAFAGAPQSSAALWDTAAHLLAYDLLVLSCEGGETYGANPAALESYVNAGGRVLASHFQYSWFAGALVSGQGYAAPSDWGTNLATWTGGAAPGDGGTSPTIGATPVTTFASGVTNDEWLGDLGALTSGELPILTPKYNAFVGINGPAQSWLLADNSSGAPGAAMLFTFDTPVNAPLDDGGAPAYCGRVAYTDLHDDQADTTNSAGGQPPPVGCVSATLSPQERELELMLFDLGGCVVPGDP